MSSAIVLIAYWAYAMVVVPVVSPSLDPNERQTVAEQIIREAGNLAERQAEELAVFFPPGSWELVDKPKMLESDQAKLLVGDYKTLPDGRVMLKPCTIIFFPKKELQEAPMAERQAVILEAPEGALLQFDGSFDLSRGKFGNGRITGGRIAGPVTIHSKGKLDDPDDDLWIATRNIHLSEEWITTNESVRFKYGKHSGAGRKMRMKLEQDDKKRHVKKGDGPRIAGMRSFQLREVDYLRLFIPEEDKTKKDGQAQPLADATATKPEPKLIPVEIGCTGGFRFDVPERRAAFKDKVEISRFRTDGPADQLSCDELVIHFVPKKKSGKSSKKKQDTGVGNLEPSWLEARGTKQPARIHSTVEEVEAFAREFQYHLADRRIVLQDKAGKEAVRLTQKGNTFIAKYIEYRPSQDPSRQLGQLVADGPGIITARLNEEKNQARPNEKSDQLFTATWQKELRIRPHEKNQVISLTGGATLDYGPTGRLTANSIHFYLLEKPKTNRTVAATGGTREKMGVELQPDKMQADGNVEINSKQISGSVDQCQFWFETVKAAPSINNALPPTNPNYPNTQPTTPYQPAGTPVAGSPGTPGAASPLGAPPQEEKKQHFHVKARVLQANVLIRELPTPDGKAKRETEVTKLTLLDNVELVETETDKPNVEPIIAKGDRIHVLNATLPSMSLSMFGRPAEFVGRGLGLAGANINLNRGTNRLWVNGPGTMRLPPMNRDLRGQAVKKAEPIIITWQQEMDFNGQVINFLEQVIAETKNQKLYTEQLSAMLTRKIDFAKSEKAMSNDRADRPELLWLTCHGGAKMNSNTFDELGRIEAIEVGEMSNLKIDRGTGKIFAKGPGYVRSVRRDKDGKMLQQIGPTGMTPARPRPAYGNTPGRSNSGQPNPAPGQPNPTPGQGAAGPEKLIYVKIRFQGFIDGDINGRLMGFNDQVRGTFGQVTDWNQELPEDDPDALGDEGALLRCQRLQLVQMPSPTGGDPGVEVEATGNVSIEGSQFTARGARASYSRQKELLILEGDGRTQAVLYMQEKAGTAPDVIPAKKIMYWPKLHRYRLGGSQSIQFQVNPNR
jgi:predicted transcriptional regulator